MIILLVPVYNEAAILVKTLQSIQQQTDQNFECWVIDDCSTDNSVEIARTFAQTMSNLRIIQKPTNTGLSSTLRYGAALVNADDYIMMLDADDYLMDTAIATLNRLINTYHPHTVEYAFCINSWYKTTRIDTMVFHDLTVLTPEQIQYYKNMGLRNGYMMVRWNKLIKKTVWDKITQYYLEGLNYWEDVIFSLAYYYSITDNDTIIVYNTPLMKYCKQMGRMSTRNDNTNKYISLINAQNMLLHMPWDTITYQKRIKYMIENLTEAKI